MFGAGPVKLKTAGENGTGLLMPASTREALPYPSAITGVVVVGWIEALGGSEPLKGLVAVSASAPPKVESDKCHGSHFPRTNEISVRCRCSGLRAPPRLPRHLGKLHAAKHSSI